MKIDRSRWIVFTTLAALAGATAAAAFAGGGVGRQARRGASYGAPVTPPAATTPADPTPGKPGPDAPAGPGDGVLVQPRLLGALVTDVDPERLLGARRRLFDVTSLPTGPFSAHDTIEVYVVALYDRRTLGRHGFDQVVRFVLPDGSLYEVRRTPVDPTALPGRTVVRPDLAPHPVDVAVPMRMRRAARYVPGEFLDRTSRRHATFTRTVLPVSGTWITRHNLYGTWTVEIEAVAGGEIVSRASTTFEIGIE